MEDELLNKYCMFASSIVKNMDMLIESNHKTLMMLPDACHKEYLKIMYESNKRIFEAFKGVSFIEYKNNFIVWKDTNINLSFNTFNKEIIESSYNPLKPMKHTIKFLWHKVIDSDKAIDKIKILKLLFDD